MFFELRLLKSTLLLNCHSILFAQIDPDIGIWCKHFLLLWLVEQHMGRLILGCDSDRRMARKLGIALQDHWLATSGLHTLDELFLKSLQIQGKSYKPDNQGQKSILSGEAANR